MRIGIEAQRLFRLHKHGMEIFALNLIRQLQLSERNMEFVVFVRPDEDTTCLRESVNLRIVPVEATSYADWEQIRLPRALVREGIDLLHCTANTGPYLCPVPLVLTLHDLFFLRQEKNSNAYQSMGNRYRSALVNRLVSSAAKVVTVSATSLKEIEQRFPGARHKLSYVAHGVHHGFGRTPSMAQYREARDTYGLPPEFFLSFGNTDPRKNTRGILAGYYEYVQRTENLALPLVVAGPSRNSVQELLNSINRPELLPRILTPGHIQARHLPSVYAMSRGFVFPSLEEGFGFPILEAMAMRTPVITSRGSATSETAGESALYVDPRDPESIAAALTIIQTQANVVHALVTSGGERARRFTWHQAAAHYGRVYRESIPDANPMGARAVSQAA